MRQQCIFLKSFVLKMTDFVIVIYAVILILTKFTLQLPPICTDPDFYRSKLCFEAEMEELFSTMPHGKIRNTLSCCQEQFPTDVGCRAYCMFIYRPKNKTYFSVESMSQRPYDDSEYTKHCRRPVVLELSHCIKNAELECQEMSPACQQEISFCKGIVGPGTSKRSAQYCSAAVDDDALHQYKIWQNTSTFPGHWLYPHSMPIKSVDECHTELWRTLACYTIYRPCTEGAKSFRRLCWNDCMYILNECHALNATSIDSFNERAAQACSQVSEKDNNDCWSFDTL